MTTVTAFIHRVRQAHPPTHTLRLQFDDHILAVHSSTLELFTVLAEYYAEFRAREEAFGQTVHITVHEGAAELPLLQWKVLPLETGKRAVKEEFVDLADGRLIRKRQTGIVFALCGQENLAVGPVTANPNQVINFINNRFIQSKLCRGGLLGHAAGVTANGHGMALAGFSGMGKSTLALHLMSQGCSFVSNDRVIVHAQGERPTMFGVPKHPRINPGTALHNPDLAALLSESERRALADRTDLWELEDKYDAPIQTFFGPQRFALRAPLDVLVLLNWGHTSAPARCERVDLAQRPDLLPAFQKRPGVFFSPPPDEAAAIVQPTLANYVHALAQCHVYEIRGKVDFAAATAFCLDLLRAPASQPLQEHTCPPTAPA
ncbi:MAG: HprK-related kinase B [Desulfohalobium sp.]